MPITLDDDRFSELVDQAIAGLPAEFLQLLENVIVQIEDQPSPRVMEAMGLEHPGELLGYYTGTPLTEGLADELIPGPAYIFIYKQNILELCHSDEDVMDEVRTTVLHEIGHHLGMDEDELDRLGYG